MSRDTSRISGQILRIKHISGQLLSSKSMEISAGLDDLTLSQLNNTLSQPVSREFHAFCRLCPPSAASRLLALDSPQLSRLSQQCRTAIDSWLCCDRNYEVVRDAPSLTSRDSTLPGKTKTRDGACVITGTDTSACEVSHIVPYSVGKSQARATGDLWAVLRMFWGEARTQELQNLIFGPQDPMKPDAKTWVNKLYNVLTLSPDAHTYWANGFFVLDPHSEDNPENRYTQRAVFRWIYPRESSRLEPGVFAPIQLTAPIPPFSTSISRGRGYIGLVDGRANPPTLIQDGAVITFSTDNPEERPLPSRELLWLQSALIRVLRMAGRAGWDLQEMNDSDSDEEVVSRDNGLIRESSRDSVTGPAAPGTNGSSQTRCRPFSAAAGPDATSNISAPQIIAGPTTQAEAAIPAAGPTNRGKPKRGYVISQIKKLRL